MGDGTRGSAGWGLLFGFSPSHDSPCSILAITYFNSIEIWLCSLHSQLVKDVEQGPAGPALVVVHV